MASHEELEIAVQTMAEGLLISDASGRVVTINPAALRLLGFSSIDDLHNASAPFPECLEMFALDGRALTAPERAVPRVLRGEAFTDYVLRVRRRDIEHEFVGSFSGVPVREADGRIRLAVVTFRDITDRIRVEEELRGTEERLRAAHLAAGVGTWEWDVQSGRTTWSPEVFQVLGRRPHEVPASVDAWVAAVHHDDRPRVRAELDRALVSGSRIGAEYRITAADGSLRWVTVRASIFRDPSGQPLRVVGLIADITARKHAEVALKASESRLRAMFDTAPVSIWEEDFTAVAGFIAELRAQGVQDFRGYFAERPEQVRRAISLIRVADVNSYSIRLFGARSREQLLHSFESIFGPESLSVIAEELVALAEGQETFASETQVRTLDGQRMDVMFTMRFSPSLLTHVIVCVIDITDRKRFEEEIVAARAEAERANRLKDDFLATLSHELRTPLNAILGYSQMLRAGVIGASDAPRALEVIERNARAQTQLVEDILDVSRIITGKLSLNRAWIDVSDTIAHAIESIRPAAEAKRIHLQASTRESLVLADADRLQQVVWNLLSNAVKFTPEGGRVQVVLTRGPGAIQIEVVDSGIGIAPDLLPVIFERFRQGDSRPAREYGGLGLGLAIAKHLVEMHGGTISVSSEGTGCGTAFRVWLPTGSTIGAHESWRGEPVIDTTILPRLDDVRVLLVDDDPDGLTMVETMLSSRGARVSAAGGSDEALAIAARETFDVIVCDLGMPKKDGYELLRELRHHHPSWLHVPAIALTAYALSEDRQKALAAGFLAHVPKPVDPAFLLQRIAALTDDRDQTRH